MYLEVIELRSTKPAHSTIYSEAQSIKNAYPNDHMNQ